jgi:hypothetical protein
MHVLPTPEYCICWLGVSDLPRSYQDAKTGYENFLLHYFKFTIHSHVTRYLISLLYCNVTECDYRRVLGWWSDLLDSLIQRVTTLYTSLLHTLVSTVTSSLPLLGSGFQRWTEHQQFSNWDSQSQNQSQSQSYFTTGGLPPISSSWRQAAWGSKSDTFFAIEPLRS